MRQLKNSELGRISVKNFKDSVKTPYVVVLDNVRSALNVGSVFRISDAFRIQKIYLCGITATPPSNEIRKSALGSTDSVEWEYSSSTHDTLLTLKKEGYRILAVEQSPEAIFLNQYHDDQMPLAFVFGNEVHGVSQESLDLCDECIEIPQFGTKHSLNISVSVGIVLWDFWSKRNIGI